MLCLVRNDEPSQEVLAVVSAWTLPPNNREAQRRQGQDALSSVGLGPMAEIPVGTVRVPVSVRGGPAIILGPDWAATECLRLGWIQPYSLPLVVTPAGWCYGRHLAAATPAAFTARVR